MGGKVQRIVAEAWSDVGLFVLHVGCATQHIPIKKPRQRAAVIAARTLPSRRRPALIEKHKRSTDRTLRALSVDMEQENTIVQDTPNGRLQKVLKIWRGMIVIFTQALDALSAVGGDITAQFTAG